MMVKSMPRFRVKVSSSKYCFGQGIRLLSHRVGVGGFCVADFLTVTLTLSLPLGD
jgi:hypothetical protein